MPLEVGQSSAEVKLYHPEMKQIVYKLQMNAEPYEEIIEGPVLELMSPYVFVLPIKNKTQKDCYV